MMTSDLFNRACLLANDETIVIRYKFNDFAKGTIKMSNKVRYLPYKSQNKMKKVLETVRKFIESYYVEVDIFSDADNLDGLLHLQENGNN